MKEKVLETIKKHSMIENGEKVVLAVSGGPDSICMLDILNDIKNDETIDINFEIVVAHVNHMIRKEAEEDEKYVKKYCEEKQIEFYSKSIDVQKMANNNKIGLEEAGRKARYDFFDEILEKTNAQKIAIAHNKNDKVETVLMHIIRGSGINGLKGIEPERGKYIRPIIECERNEIEEYCTQKNLQPRIDKTNFENIYTRNKIRNVIIPYIKEEFNPNIIETIDRLSKLVTEQESYIQKQVQQIYKEIAIEELNQQSIVLDLKQFNRQEKVIKSNLIIYIITRLFHTAKGIERIHIEDIITLCEKNIGNKFLMPNKNLKVFVKNGKIKFSREV